MADQIEELLLFLRLDSRVDLKSAALQYVLGLTGSREGQTLIKDNPSLLRALFDLLKDKHPSIAHHAHLCVLSLSGTEDISDLILTLDVFPLLLELVVDSKCAHADKVCMIMSNLVRSIKGAETFIKECQSSGHVESTCKAPSLYQLVDIFNRKDFNKTANFHYLATLFLNISQLQSGRQLFLNRQLCIMPRLLAYTQFVDSVIRRGGVVGLLKNLCFEVGSHQWLLSDNVDILPALLLPLAGPESFEDDEMERLPDELQYLPDDKARDDDPDIRVMCIEAIMKLCSTKFARECIRSKNAYLILKEYHKWEKDPQAAEACEKLIHILIADEPEKGLENLHEVELPENYAPELKPAASNSKQTD